MCWCWHIVVSQRVNKKSTGTSYPTWSSADYPLPFLASVGNSLNFKNRHLVQTHQFKVRSSLILWGWSSRITSLFFISCVSNARKNQVCDTVLSSNDFRLFRKLKVVFLSWVRKFPGRQQLCVFLFSFHSLTFNKCCSPFRFVKETLFWSVSYCCW